MNFFEISEGFQFKFLTDFLQHFFVFINITFADDAVIFSSMSNNERNYVNINFDKSKFLKSNLTDSTVCRSVNLLHLYKILKYIKINEKVRFEFNQNSISISIND